MDQEHSVEHLVDDPVAADTDLVDRVVARGLVDRRPGPTDARAVELTLTAEGERLAREVAKIEEGMYAAIDAITGPDVHVTLDFLRAFVEGSPVGQAFARRVALTDSPRLSTAGRSRTPAAD